MMELYEIHDCVVYCETREEFNEYLEIREKAGWYNNCKNYGANNQYKYRRIGRRNSDGWKDRPLQLKALSLQELKNLWEVAPKKLEELEIGNVVSVNGKNYTILAKIKLDEIEYLLDNGVYYKRESLELISDQEEEVYVSPYAKMSIKLPKKVRR